LELPWFDHLVVWFGRLDGGVVVDRALVAAELL
jgi:hypothetical protein